MSNKANESQEGLIQSLNGRAVLLKRTVVELLLQSGADIHVSGSLN